ncbi:MAG: TolC family protein [Gemmatimonadetes bacterium]|nr:TolC family protein [Gemmatimonadota bacterium]MBI3569163.1 TolC family protein [Gemmatimonadota bacterium]
MKVGFRRLSAGLALVPALAVAQTGEPRAVSLDEAVRLAQQNAPSTVQARNALRTGDAGVRFALSQYIPSLNLTGTAAQSGGTTFFQGALVPFKGDAWNYSKGYSMNLQLFDGGQRWYNYKAANANVDAFVANEVNARYNVALNVKQQYYAVLAARESESAANRQLEQAVENLKVAQLKVVAGTATRSDSLRAAIQVANARLSILTAQNNVRVANASLTRLIGSTTQVTAVAADTADIGNVVIDSVALARYADEGPSVRQAAAQLAAARSAHQAASTPYLPTLTAAFRDNLNNSNDRFTWGGGPTSSSTNLSFNFSYPLFNNYSREQNLTVARVNEDNAEATYKDVRLGQQQQLTQLIGTLRTAQERVAIQLVTIASADEDLRVQKQRYNLGASTLLDVLTSESTLDAARAALIQARFDARTAKAQVEALVGRDLR